MVYEQSEPVATCDGCGKALYEGDEAWTCAYVEPDSVVAAKIHDIRDWGYHYCCTTPCLERAVVSYVRQLRAPVPQTCHSPNQAPPQDGP